MTTKNKTRRTTFKRSIARTKPASPTTPPGCAGEWPKLYYVVQTVDTETGEVTEEWTPDEFDVAARQYFREGRAISEHNAACEEQDEEEKKENSEVRMIEVEVRPVRRYPM